MTVARVAAVALIAVGFLALFPAQLNAYANPPRVKAPPRAKAPPRVPAKPTKPKLPPTVKPFKVSVRHTAPTKARAANQAIAHRMVLTLRAQGWSASSAKDRYSKRYIVTARMLRWHQVAVAPNAAMANMVASNYIRQGFQARVTH